MIDESEIETDYSGFEIVPEADAPEITAPNSGVPVPPWSAVWHHYKSTDSPKLKRKLRAIFHRRALEDHPDQIACPYCREKALEKTESANPDEG